MPWSEVTVEARTVLLDALEALSEHLDALVLVGAQAIYLHTGEADVPIATSTTDADLAVIPSLLEADPSIDVVMKGAGFSLDLQAGDQPGAWRSAGGVAVDLLVPKALDAGAGRRSADLKPHPRHTARKVVGLEGAAVDRAPMEIRALEPSDQRAVTVNVAGAGALVVAKVHKIAERAGDGSRARNKDAHDLYRLLRATDSAALAQTLTSLSTNPDASAVTTQAIEHLRKLAAERTSEIPVMAAETEGMIAADPDEGEAIALRTWVLAQEVLERL